MTLGFDPAKGRFVGTFVASMMHHLWIYEGGLDAGRNALTLHTEGPGVEDDVKMAQYRDVITFEDDDYRVMTSSYQRDDGTWQLFMTAHYRRAGLPFPIDLQILIEITDPLGSTAGLRSITLGR
jgi:hypothetical protein